MVNIHAGGTLHLDWEFGTVVISYEGSTGYTNYLREIIIYHTVFLMCIANPRDYSVRPCTLIIHSLERSDMKTVCQTKEVGYWF